VTFRSGITKTRIDYFLIRANNRGMCKDYKMIPSEYLETQHRLLVMDVVIKKLNIMKGIAEEPIIRWWNLTRDKGLIYQRRLKQKGGQK